jgi:glycosyltransferase involved in cell wall biosynthesis
MRRTPTVSVIMACHNAEAYVGEAVGSVLAQTSPDLELVVVDDRSTDDSVAVIRALAAADDRVRCLESRVNGGAAAARNRAIAEASGEWLAVLDADDVFLEDKLERQMRLIRGGPESLVLVGTGCHQVDDAGRHLSTHLYPTASARLKDHLLRWKPFPPHSSVMYRAAAVRAAGGFDDRFCPSEDYDLWLRLSDTGEFASVDAPLVRYRRHQTNISNAVGSTGYTQLEYGAAATACHLLRRAGAEDPSRAEDPRVWPAFMAHVAEVVRASGEREYRQWKAGWRGPGSAGRGGAGKGRPALRELASRPAWTLRLLTERAAGNGLPRRCMQSWLAARSCADS